MERRGEKGEGAVNPNFVQNALAAAEICVGVSPITTLLPFVLVCVRNRSNALLNRLRSSWLAIIREESGQDSMEYALLTALIALAAVVALQAVAEPINNSYSVITSKFHKHIGKHLGQSK